VAPADPAGPRSVTTDGAFELAPLGSVPESVLMDMLTRSFDRTFTSAWYQWKHRDGPWGPSHGTIAVDDEGPVGLLLCLPWQLGMGSGTAVVSRPVDSCTLPRARRRGVLRALVADELARQRTLGAPLLFCTTTPESAGANRGIGATVLTFPRTTSLTPLWCRARGGRVALVSARAAVASYPAHAGRADEAQPTITTRWEPSALRWRFEPRSGRHYRGATLQHADGPAGLVYRIEHRRGLRTLVSVLLWGDRRSRLALLGGTGRAERAVVVLETTSTRRGDCDQAAPGPRVRRGQSLMCVWDLDDSSLSSTDSERWHLTVADLEGVM
jgi:hypothetical protein